MKIVEDARDNSAIRVLDLGLGAEGYKERFANVIRYTLHVLLATSTARCLKEQVPYQAATVVKAELGSEFDEKFIGSSLVILRWSGVAPDSAAHTGKFLNLRRI